MRIAVFSFEFPPETAFGGISTYSAQLASMLAERGHDVEVFAGGALARTFRHSSGAQIHTVGCMDQLEFALPAAISFGARHRACPFDVIEAPEYQAPARFALRLAPEVASVIRLHTPTALLSRINTPRSLWRLPAREILRQLKAIGAALIRSEPPPSLHLAHRDIRASWELDALEAEQAQKCDLLCSPSKVLVDYPATAWRVPKPKTLHLPNIFTAAPALTALPLAGRGCTLGFFGRLEERKGIQTLLHALPLLAAAHKNLRLICVGESKFLQSENAQANHALSVLCKRLGVQIELPGRVTPNEIPNWLGRCRVVILPSIWENFPYACLEAMAAGCAVVGSKSGGMPDMIEEGRTGFLAASGDYRSFARHCTTLLTDDALSNRIGAAAREHVVSTYAPAVLCERYADAYREAITLHASRTPSPRS
jgi:glycosyltransferase involved in cell wall biosynthesis